MATLKHAESRRLYSWWWDSHISPKNSKWLQENLTDMDIKVKAMIKLLEEDADSFARRAEMYYKKRPELMKLVEEFYRAYRALAERYDHATGALRQAHRTMAEAFPNQVPMVLTDDSPLSSSGTEAEPHTPEMAHPVRAVFDPDDFQKDALGVSLHLPAIKRNGTHMQENDAVMSKKGLKQLNDMFASGDGTDHAKFADGRVRKGLKFQEQEKKGSENTTYNVSRDIQNHIVEENDEAKRKIRTLHDEVSQLSAEKQNLREKVLSESERAYKAEDKLESLQPALAKLQSEKEAALLQYKQCLDRVSNLEAEISRGQADFSRLNGEIEEGASKLKAAEERILLLEKANQSLQSEVDLLVPRTMMQQQEITNKNEELEKLRICIQDERMHLMHAEAALQSLQSLHSQSQEEQRILALELQHGVQMLTEMEFRKQCLEDEILKVKEENHSLSEEKISSSMSIKNLQDEIFSLKEMKGKLEEEVGLRIDQRNALQQELYCLREELNDLDRRHHDVIKQIESVGLNVDGLGSSVKDLQGENLSLKQICRDNENEKAVLSEKLETMEKLLEKNSLLENSLSDASAELEGLRERLKMLEESFQSLLREKSTLDTEKSFLLSQVETIMHNVEELSEKNSMLENSLSDANVELEGLRAKSKSLDESCQVLQDEKSNLLLERDGLISQVETIRQCLENLEKRHVELEDQHLSLEKEKESALHCINELQVSLNLEKQKHEVYIQSSQTEIISLNVELESLREKSKSLGESCQVLQDEKSNLLLERDGLISQVETIRQGLESLEKRHVELEDQHLSLEKEQESALHCINELQVSLNLEKQKHEVYIQSSQTEIISLNVELESLREKSKSLGESCQVLQDEKSNLLLERDGLISQVETIRQCLENLEKRHVELEDQHLSLEKEKESALHCINELQVSLNLEKQKHEVYIQSSQTEIISLNVELESLREKSKSLGESCQVLQDEKSNLLLERDSLISQVETIRHYLEKLEKRHADIEDQHSCMEKERESALHRVDELQISLNLEKQKHETHIKSSETQLATLGSQIHDLLEEVQLRKQLIEEVQDKFMNAEVEIFVFQRCICDMKERNLLLLIECQEHIEASVCAKKLISELEQEKLKQQMEVDSLLEENKNLRIGIHHVSTSLDNDMDYGFHNTTTSEELFSLILRKVKDMKNSALDTEDEKQRLLFEKTVSATLLEQLQLDASVLASEKHALEQESEMRIQELLVIQSEKHALVEMNSQLREHLCDRGEKLGILMGEVEILHEQLSDSQKAHQILHDGSTKLHEENQSLKSEVFNLEEENHILQEENISILGEAIAQGNLSLIFEGINSEKGMELKTFNDKLDHLSGVSSELEQVRVMVNKAEAENASLKESLASMEKFRIYAATLENELNGVRNVTEELNHKVETGKNLLDQKDMELSQADEKLKAILCENAELLKEISDLKYREEKLNSDLQENINVVKQLEMEAAALYEDLQINSICLALFEEKALELICSCKCLRENIMVQERMFDDERASRNAGNEDLKEKNGALERENGGLNAELSLYLPLILSLKDSIASLEEQTLVLKELHLTDNQETQNVAAASHLHDISGEELNGANNGKVPDGVVELQELQTRIQAVEKIMKSGKVMMQASSITNARLEVAMKEIEELKSKSNLSQNEDFQTRKDLVVQQGEDTEPGKNVLNDKAEASKGKNELMMKDIQLDLVSDSSSHHNGVDAYGIRESGKSEADDGMLELWETAEQDSSWEPSTIKEKQQPMSADFDDMVEYHQIEAVEEQKSEYPSSELQAEKEPAVDKLELSEKALESKQDGNKRILERLASDARRLTNLQATAQELKKKFEKSEKANQLLGFEYDSVKAQLKEVVEAIAQLVDMNNKLTKNTEDGSASSNSKAELEEKGYMRRRQVSERARRWSEKIGRLELEVQRIQFVMLKLESEYENKGTKGFDRRTRVLLRDYLYGGRERRRRKKVPCCVCMRPTTKSD